MENLSGVPGALPPYGGGWRLTRFFGRPIARSPAPGCWRPVVMRERCPGLRHRSGGPKVDLEVALATGEGLRLPAHMSAYATVDGGPTTSSA
ncbi:hypothetical protein GCM10027425_33340 [Alteromonas gracilis]